MYVTARDWVDKRLSCCDYTVLNNNIFLEILWCDYAVLNNNILGEYLIFHYH